MQEEKLIPSVPCNNITVREDFLCKIFLRPGYRMRQVSSMFISRRKFSNILFARSYADGYRTIFFPLFRKIIIYYFALCITD